MFVWIIVINFWIFPVVSSVTNGLGLYIVRQLFTTFKNWNPVFFGIIIRIFAATSRDEILNQIHCENSIHISIHCLQNYKELLNTRWDLLLPADETAVRVQKLIRNPRRPNARGKWFSMIIRSNQNRKITPRILLVSHLFNSFCHFFGFVFHTICIYEIDWITINTSNTF